MVKLADPQRCMKCGARGRIVDTRMRKGFRKRRRRCACGHKWNSYETLIDPRRLRASPPTSSSERP